MSSLLKLYEYYFTATDVKVFLSDPTTGKQVYVDLANGIGYDYNVSSIPIYTVGSSVPTFFSKGNFLGQGMLVVPFKDEQYLKVMLQHIFEEESTVIQPRESIGIKDMTDAEFRAKRIKASKKHVANINIGSITKPFDIKIVLDNSSSFYDASPKIILLESCKITGESLDVSSSQDKIVQQGYKFYFKEIKRVQI